ncbi:MAG: hypothetical protein LBT97_10235 [Planctomycetota bacterium]|nr:hypothetical protein [Planctomycetota bacterium]
MLAIPPCLPKSKVISTRFLPALIGSSNSEPVGPPAIRHHAKNAAHMTISANTTPILTIFFMPRIPQHSSLNDRPHDGFLGIAWTFEENQSNRRLVSSKVSGRSFQRRFFYDVAGLGRVDVKSTHWPVSSNIFKGNRAAVSPIYFKSRPKVHSNNTPGRTTRDCFPTYKCRP